MPRFFADIIAKLPLSGSLNVPHPFIRFNMEIDKCLN